MDLSNVKSHLHFDGVDASTTFTDEKVITWTAAGNAQLDTAQKVFGTASLLLDGTGDYIYTGQETDFILGTNNFSIGLRIRPHIKETRCIYNIWEDDGPSSSFSVGLYALANGSIAAVLFDGTTYITLQSSADIYTIDEWSDVHVSRSGNSLYLFVNGVLVDSDTYAFNFNIGTSGYIIYLGRDGSPVGTTYFNGWIDEFILSNGSAFYTSDYASPYIPYSNYAIATINDQDIYTLKTINDVSMVTFKTFNDEVIE